jgi:hypothetical protein
LLENQQDGSNPPVKRVPVAAGVPVTLSGLESETELDRIPPMHFGSISGI